MKPADFSALPCLLTKKQAAYVLQISVRKIDLLRKAHELRSVKIGELVRFEAGEVLSFIARHRTRRRFFDVSHLQG